MKYLIKVQFIVFCLFSTFEGASQKVAAYNNPELQYQNGLELFNKNQFVSAQKCFQEYIQTSKVSLLKSDASYYNAACAIEVFNKDGEWLMKRFVELNPSSNKLNSAYFYLAKSSYRKKKHKETLKEFQASLKKSTSKVNVSRHEKIRNMVTSKFITCAMPMQTNLV